MKFRLASATAVTILSVLGLSPFHLVAVNTHRKCGGISEGFVCPGVRSRFYQWTPSKSRSEGEVKANVFLVGRRRRVSIARSIDWFLFSQDGEEGGSQRLQKTTTKSKRIKSDKEEEDDLEVFLASLDTEAENVRQDYNVDMEDYDDDEELSDQHRAMLAAPAKKLDELLKDAGIEFGDPTLMEDDQGSEGFRAGFVSIIGSPNVGKSTLMNSLVGERVSIVTSKQQTTRHQIMGVVTGEDFQIVYYDTPGVLRPNYKLQEGMMAFVKESLGDADVVLLMTDVFEDPRDFPDQQIFEHMQQSRRPLLLAVNKIDLLPNATHPQGNLGKDALERVGTLQDVVARWQAALPNASIIPISAREYFNLDELLASLKEELPPSPPLYPNDTLTDKPQRFFASELIREKLFTSYSKEIPYSCEVSVTGFKDQGRLIKINSTIFTTRDSHVPILIGTKGSKLKEVGTQARLDLENFFGKKIYLEMRVKVRKDWRSNLKDLSAFGYMQQGRETENTNI